MTEPFVPTCEQLDELYSTFRNVEYQPVTMTFKIWGNVKDFATVHSMEELFFNVLGMESQREYALWCLYHSHFISRYPPHGNQ